MNPNNLLATLGCWPHDCSDGNAAILHTLSSPSSSEFRCTNEGRKGLLALHTAETGHRRLPRKLQAWKISGALRSDLDQWHTRLGRAPVGRRLAPVEPSGAAMRTSKPRLARALNYTPNFVWWALGLNSSQA
ncbi:hypothetical protein BX600DRAFT_147134 [Xylariales sp. PMI_506]|nr:hypothetical protein BX600DRAFT_147134 [Xylariales sp. PMI_506]